MKISKLFHWLYFIVMMLPIFTIPIFAIYSHRHQINDYTVVVDETKVVNFNQLYNYDFVSDSSVTFSYDDFLTTVTFNNSDTRELYCLTTTNISLVEGHLYYLRYIPDTALNGYSNSLQFYINSQVDEYPYVNSIRSEVTFIASINNNVKIGLQIPSNSSGNFSSYLNFYDLTQMGYASTSEFNSDYPNNAYAYTKSDKQLLLTGNTITYDNTDIGSQFTYDVYNVVDKYFNYDNVFNFKDLYSWLNITFFDGCVPLGFFIFWHLLIYWLLTSILWLIFDILMYVPQLVHRWLDKASLS